MRYSPFTRNGDVGEVRRIRARGNRVAIGDQFGVFGFKGTITPKPLSVMTLRVFGLVAVQFGEQMCSNSGGDGIALVVEVQHEHHRPRGSKVIRDFINQGI